MKKRILYLVISIFAICILHNLLFQFGFFGGSTYGYFNNEKVRVLKIKGQKALISPQYITKDGVVFTKNENDHWVDLNKLDFKVAENNDK